MSDTALTCPVCPRHCSLKPGQIGFCRARKNTGSRIECLNYGHITSAALDPIEKKPLYHFHPGSHILSVGSYGCNLICPFCQNHDISQAGAELEADTLSPDELLSLALELKEKEDNIGAAFTYNEPLIGYEYVKDCSVLLKKHGLCSAVITNGNIKKDILLDLLPYIDAFNIDLKGFNQKAYDLLGGDLETVKTFIETAHSSAHVEVTSLIVPTVNDSLSEMEEQARYLAALDPEIPLHITRYFPRWKFREAPTDIRLLYELEGIAKKYLKNVHIGNV